MNIFIIMQMLVCILICIFLIVCVRIKKFFRKIVKEQEKIEKELTFKKIKKLRGKIKEIANEST